MASNHVLFLVVMLCGQVRNIHRAVFCDIIWEFIFGSFGNLYFKDMFVLTKAMQCDGFLPTMHDFLSTFACSVFLLKLGILQKLLTHKSCI